MNFLLKSSTRALRPTLSTIPRARPQVRFATQDYGSGAGNPAGEKPEKQGANPSESLEHPGPAPPKVAKGQSSSSPNEDSSSSTSGQASQKSGQSSSSASSNDKKGAQPKILNESPPSKGNESEDVRKHNEDMDNRTEKAFEQVSNKDAEKDKVGKDFWKGQGGRDRDP